MGDDMTNRNDDDVKSPRPVYVVDELGRPIAHDKTYYLQFYHSRVLICDERGTLVPDEFAVGIARRILDRYLPYYLYLGADGRADNRYKIGISTDPRRRLAKVGAWLEWSIKVGARTDALRIENSLHEYLKALGKHDKGEWFLLSREDVGVITCHTTYKEMSSFCWTANYIMRQKQIKAARLAGRSIFQR